MRLVLRVVVEWWSRTFLLVHDVEIDLPAHRAKKSLVRNKTFAPSTTISTDAPNPQSYQAAVSCVGGAR